MNAILSKIGGEQTFELIEFLIILFVLMSAATLVSVFTIRYHSRREVRTTDQRLETILQHLGRNLFGDEAWKAVEQTLAGDQARIDSFLSVLDRESFDSWAESAMHSGEVPDSEIELLRSRLIYPAEKRRVIARVPVTECNPTLGMPVAVHQDATQTRATVTEVGKKTFTIWVLGEDNGFDESREASFVLLSRSGTFQFDSAFSQLPDNSLLVQMPARSTRSQRRRFDRFPARLPVDVVRLNESTDTVEATITELSGGGATVTDPSGSFDDGHVLILSFEACGHEYSVTGRVIRADDGALHIRFEAMRDQERLQIAQSVVTLAPANSG
jgi:hypothetical protein